MPDVSLADLPAQLALALSLASSSTGTDYHYLMNTARTESSFQTEAKAPTSSAQGLFQFIEETWIRTIKDEGGRYGLGPYAAMITKTPDGHYSVDTPEHRAAILRLRNNAKVSAMMAAAYAKQNTEFVENAIGRRPNSDELYLAHFLGPADAVRLIEYRDVRPSYSAPDLFPAAAKANRAIFYGDWGPRSVGQVYDLLVTRQHGGAPADTGALFGAGIDFGSWSAKVEKTHQRAAAPNGARLAAKAEMHGSSGWEAEVDAAPAAAQTPYITVADDYPSSLIGGDQAPAVAAAVAPVIKPLRVADAGAEAPRLKIIHVP